MKLQSDDRKRLDSQRSAAARYFIENYSREERYLRIFERDLSRYLSSSDFLASDDARNYQVYWDFILCFEQLRDFMKEFRWSKDFLKDYGIDFVAAKKLYFSVV